MSWYVKTIGAPANVKAKVTVEQYVPDAIKAAVASLCDSPLPSDSQVLVETQGHHDSVVGINNGSKVIIEVVSSASPVVKPVS